MAKAKNMKKPWAIISIILGVIVLAAPQIIAWAIGLYLIITGILSLADKK
jgi:uncharacterized membrane protein HdeD (DUF308 family)